MADPPGVLDGDADGVAPADEQVAGVEAERDAAAGQHAVGLLARLDHGADVGVQGREQAVLGRGVRDPVEVGQQRRPLGVVEHRALVVALRAGGGGDDDRGRLRGGERLHGRTTSGRGSDAGSCSTTGTNWPTARSPAAASVRALASGASGRNPSGPNSVAARPTSRICSSTRSGPSWWPQPGTSHTPQEIGAPATRSRSGVGVVVWLISCPSSGGQVVGWSGSIGCVGAQAVGISDSSTRRPSCSETVQASATRKASRASRTVHGLSTSPRATERKWVSSAR